MATPPRKKAKTMPAVPALQRFLPRKSRVTITISLCFILPALISFGFIFFADSRIFTDYAPKSIIGNTRLLKHKIDTLNNIVFVKQDEQHECFDSPYIVCGDDISTFWVMAEKWRQKLVDLNMSTQWLPVVKELKTEEKTNIIGNSNTSIALKLKNTTTNGKDQTIKIAVYNRPVYIGLQRFDFSKCEYNNCKYVGKKNTKDVDILVVFNIDFHTRVKVPRWPDQIFVMMGWESPVHSGDLHQGKDDWWNWAFNMTVNYRVGSDVFSPYAYLKSDPKPANHMPDYAAIARGKTKMVAWIVSHCGAHSKRDQYVKELKKHIEVDIYGKCGKPCPKDPDYCGKDLSKYRYYLSFENSICEDYVTDKFFKAFNNSIIPVVRGGTDFKKFFPSQMYIDVNNFESPKKLAEELIKLSTDVETYTGYLKTIDAYRLMNHNIQSFTCELCKKLNMVDYSKSTYYDMKTWLGGNTHCRRQHDY